MTTGPDPVAWALSVAVVAVVALLLAVCLSDRIANRALSLADRLVRRPERVSPPTAFRPPGQGPAERPTGDRAFDSVVRDYFPTGGPE
jgi:hypothetical protein